MTTNSATNPSAWNAFDDYDIYEGDYATDPHATWQAMRAAGCPVAHSDCYGGSWLPVDYAELRAITRDPARFSSRAIEAGGPVPPVGRGLPTPPVTSDPPRHKADRDVLMPFFRPAKVAEWEPFVRELCAKLVTELAGRGGGDAVTDFAQHLPMAVLGKVLGLSEGDQSRFTDWTTRMLREGPRNQSLREATIKEIMGFLGDELAARRADPADDLISHVAHATVDGEPLSEQHQRGALFLVTIAGADTTWSTLGASLWHLGSHPEDRDRLASEPELIPTAVEELLRYYAPVTMARITTEPVTIGGRAVGAQERVLMTFPAANRDPAAFDAPDRFVIDRRRNKHLTFGSGIHRCIGSGLARLELTVAIEEWLRVMPRFVVPDPGATTWTAGAVRGPESVGFLAES